MHPTPWQLELYALGEDLIEVREHLPCAECEAALERLTSDPGPVPVGILEGIDKAPPSGPSWLGVAAAAAAIGIIGGGLLLPALFFSSDMGPGEDVDAERTASPSKERRRLAPDPVEEEVPPTLPEFPPDREMLTVRLGAPADVGFAADGHAYNPVWSRDGAHLAFEVNNYGDRSDLYIASGSLSEAARVNLPGGGGPFGGSQVVVNPVWHPQGIVVFEGSNAGGQFRLYYYQPGGGAAFEMIRTRDVPGDLTFPTINPDGTVMSFVADQTGNGDIYTRDTNTGKVTVAMTTDVAEMFPQFDSAGSKLLFTRKQNHTEDIFELQLSTGAETSVIGGSNDQTRPDYVTGGVVYFDNSRDAQSWDLKVVSGGTARTLARSVRLPLRARPAVSPDGAWVAYGFEDPARSGAIGMSRADGSRGLVIDTELTACGEPALTERDGRTLLAFTALESGGADFRTLHVMDITDAL